MRKVLKCTVSICLTLMAMHNTINVTYAANNKGKERSYSIEKNQKSNDMKENNFSDNRKEHRNINEKINDEVNKLTGEIDSEVEVFLNENGIFDDEILAMFTEEQIDEFKEEGTDNLQVFTSYLAVNDSEELADQPVDFSETIELTDDQVDKYIAQKYYDEDTDLNEELEEQFNEISESINTENDKNSVIDSVLEKIGLKPMTVYAASSKGYLSETSGGKDDKNAPTMLKKTIVATQSVKMGYVHVSITFTWTDMPKYRGLDAIGIEWDYARWNEGGTNDTVSARHFWTYDTHHWINNNGLKPTKITAGSGSKNLSQVSAVYSSAELTKDQFHLRPTYLIAAIDLHNENEGGVFNGFANYTAVYYKTEGVSFNFYVKPDSKDSPFIIFYPDYQHLITTTNYVKLGVTFLGTTSASGFIKASYATATGAFKSVSTETSGNIVRFKFLCK